MFFTHVHKERDAQLRILRLNKYSMCYINNGRRSLLELDKCCMLSLFYLILFGGVVC